VALDHCVCLTNKKVGRETNLLHSRVFRSPPCYRRLQVAAMLPALAGRRLQVAAMRLQVAACRSPIPNTNEVLLLSVAL
jgi:hypothetical protein